MDYLLHIMFLVALYGGITCALDLPVGHAGQVSLSHAAFVGIGAYTAGVAATILGVPLPISLVLAAAVAGSIGACFALLAHRLRGDYLALATLCGQVIMFHIFNNCTAVTGGPLGLGGIPSGNVGLGVVEDRLAFAVIGAGYAAAVFGLCAVATTGHFGRVIHALREDELFLRACGREPRRAKTAVMLLSAMLAGFGGGLYAHYVTFVDPTSFTLQESLFVLLAVIIGGVGSRWGPVVGAAVMIIVPEALRFVGLPSNAAAHVRQAMIGAMLVGVVVLRPAGICGASSVGRAVL